MKFLIVSALILSSSLSYSYSTLVENDCPDCNYAPVSSSPEFTFADASRNFAKSEKITPEELIGSWKQVAGAQIENRFGASGLMGYDENGLQHSNGVFTLHVNATTVSGGFFENDPQHKITVNMENLGAGDQGPYDVVVNEAGQACFSTQAYGASKVAYYAFECRKLKNNNSKILCAVSFNANGSRTVNDAQRFYDGKVGLFLGFVRK